MKDSERIRAPEYAGEKRYTLQEVRGSTPRRNDFCDESDSGIHNPMAFLGTAKRFDAPPEVAYANADARTKLKPAGKPRRWNGGNMAMKAEDEQG